MFRILNPVSILMKPKFKLTYTQNCFIFKKSSSTKVTFMDPDPLFSKITVYIKWVPLKSQECSFIQWQWAPTVTQELPQCMFLSNISKMQKQPPLPLSGYSISIILQCSVACKQKLQGGIDGAYSTFVKIGSSSPWSGMISLKKHGRWPFKNNPSIGKKRDRRRAFR